MAAEGEEEDEAERQSSLAVDASTEQESPLKSHMRVVLEAGVWALLDSEARGAVRLTDKCAMAIADGLIDAVQLPVPAAAEPGGPSAASMAAFHSRLPLKSLLVHVPEGAPLVATQFCAEYAAAASAAPGRGLSAELCEVYAYGKELSPLLLLLLQHALPRMQGLCIIGTGSAPPVSASLLAALRPLHGLRALHISWPRGQEWFEDMEDELLGALCCLTQLHALRFPWVLTPTQLQRLGRALPALETFGLAGIKGACPAGAFPALHTLTNAPEGDSNLHSPVGRWDQARTCSVDVRLLGMAPALQRLDGIEISLSEEDWLAGRARDVPAIVEHFSSCAGGWALQVHLRGGSHPAGMHPTSRLVCDLPASSLPGLRNMHVLIDGGDSTLPSVQQDSCMALGLACLAAAAPNITDVELQAAGCPTEVVTAAIPALRQLRRLEIVWVGLPRLAHDMLQGAVLMGLASGLCVPCAVTGSRCASLCAIYFAGANPAIIGACNRLLEAQGVAARAHAW